MENQIKKYKVGIDSETFAISLVTEPAIESDFIALAKQEPKQVLLESNERHVVVGSVLIPDRYIYRYDGVNEYYISFSKESIQKMAYDYLINDRQHNVTLQHEEDSPLCSLVESWIVEDEVNDKSRKFGLDAPVGSWVCAMKINNLETWERIKSGELRGFSVESFVSLEDFSKQIKKESDTMEINENFWSQLRSIITDALKKDEPKVEELESQEEPVVEEEVKEDVVELEKQVEDEVKEDEVKPNEEVELEKVDEPIVEEPSEKEIELQKQIDELQANLAKMIEENKNLKEENIKLSAEPSTKPIMAKGEKTNMSAIDMIDAIRDGSYWNK